jgi:hypothetical protein
MRPKRTGKKKVIYLSLILGDESDRMKLYLKIYFSSEGATIMDVISIAEKLGFSPYVGDFDFVLDFDTPEEYAEITQKLHEMLKGTKTMYKVSTRN